MRDLKDLKREGEGASPKKKPPYLAIGVLALLVFLMLVFVFKRKGEAPAPPVTPPITQAVPAPKAPEEKVASTAEEAPAPDPGVKPGEMHFDSKTEPFPAGAPPAAPKQNESAGATPPAPTPKEDLTFFKTLKDKKEKSVALQPKKESLPKKQSEPMKTSLASHPTASPGGAYTVQVASFAEKKGAQTLAEKLKRKGYDAYVKATPLPQKGTWYRVRIGHYPSRVSAQKVADRIHGSEKLNFFITSD
ncbi:MAG: SPOR domain-containing protein [Nitrospirae bacterium]|nr:SPOR domain-containing protein [Candidatus Manganitrophaceae bacterium]